ncbi:bromodomain-containing protein 4-like isoform X33 [Mercenaria mercenaria]|uniref:bromodomain-containing protein 4-like isoform X33 n=1 Tax=Mercenaria mercenaria TaxID=6596 RepID=UPI00234EF361|nr:bromodomain-containing protein 4-like isoform X33 [Mercenaria mercenaria]
MALAAMPRDREPEVARFIDTYKYDQDMNVKRDRFGGGTSLPLNSDGYEDKQKVLRDERHKDWLVQQDKPRVLRNAYYEEPTDRVYYRVGTPEQGFPAGFGEYEKQRRENNLIRQKDYNDMIKKQRQTEQQKMEARRHAPPPRPAQPPGPQMDYNLAGEQARAEERRAYQDYMGNYQIGINVPQRPVMDYWENQKFLKEERRREYNELMEKKAKEERYWAMRGRPVTPPGGLNIGNYDRQVKEQAQAKKQEYKKMLDEQKLVQLKLRAMDHVADVSPKYVRYRDEERPLVGSHSDFNPYMQEKESKDKFRRDLRSKPIQNPSPSTQNVVTETSPREDPNFKAFLDVEKEKVKNKRKYAEELLKQQKEHMFLRARQEPEMAVLDRHGQPSQYLADKPPAGPSYGRGRDESSRQTPAFWNEGKQAQGPRSLNSDASRSNRSSAYVPMALKTESYSRPIPERPTYGQPPYPGVNLNQNDERFNPDAPAKFQPKSPEKPVDREFLKVPMRDDERPQELGTPLAFKLEPQTQSLKDQSSYEQQAHHESGQIPSKATGEWYLSEGTGRLRSPADLPPRSPEKPANPEWLKIPVRDDERPPGVGTPLAFKTNSYSRQPPPAPEKDYSRQPPPAPEQGYSHQPPPSPKKGYSRQPPPAPEQGYSRQPLPPSRDQGYRAPPFSSDGQKPYRKYENGPEGLFGRPDQSRERPRSRRSLDADRKYSPTKRENVAMPVNQISPRRMKNALYTDSEEVSTKRREASKERQKEYNDLLRMKAEKKRHEDEMFRQQQQQSKPAEVVKNPFYSSDDYEKFQKELQRKQGEEYREFLSQLPSIKKIGVTPEATGISLPVGQYDKARPLLEKQRNVEYNKLIDTGRIGKKSLREKISTPPNLQGLPIGQQNYERMYRAMEHERNREYNEFLQQKYGGNKTLRTTRSEPNRTDHPKSSFYYGNELEHAEKKRMLDEERRNEYHQYMKEHNHPRSTSIEIPSDVDSGLPIGQQHHEAMRKFLSDQRNKEYNQLVDRKKNEVRNRNWNFDQNGVLELHGDDAVQSRQRELRAERKQDYNAYISQIKAPARRTWPEPEGLGALLVRKGEYDNIRQMHDEERKRDYIDRMQKRREMGLDMTPPSAPAEPLRARYEYSNPMVNVLGRYDDFRKKLADDRKRDFRTFMDQVKEDDSHRRHYVSTAPTIAREETPIVYSMGTYETETKIKIREERKKDLEEFVHEKQKHWTPRTTVKENLMPHVASAETPLVNYMGSYDNDRLKYRLERNKELRDFSQKKKQELRNPYDNYVYPTVAVAEKPIVDFLGTEVEKRKQHLRAERRQDYEQYTKQVASNNQKVTNPGRRHDFVDSTNGPYDGLFHGLGEHGNRSDDLNRERQKDYNDRLEQKYAGKDRPSGRPKWVQESLPNDTDRGRSPMKTQPPVDQYQQMLNEKRREEANLRRFEDPEYQERLSRGRDRGEAGQRYGY